MLKKIGTVLGIGGILVWGAYMLLVFIPAIQADITNPVAVSKGFMWSLVCGGISTLGAIMVKSG